MTFFYSVDIRKNFETSNFDIDGDIVYGSDQTFVKDIFGKLCSEKHKNKQYLRLNHFIYYTQYIYVNAA